MFARRRSSHHRLVVQGVRGADDHVVHVRMLDNRAPVGRRQFRAVLRRRSREEILPPRAERDHAHAFTCAHLGAVGRSDVTRGAEDADSDFW